MHLVRWLMASPLKGASKLYLGGNNGFGQLGDNTILARSSPVLVSSNYWKSFALGTSHVIAVRSDGALFGWGNNDYGQVGNGFVLNLVSSPVQIGTSSWTSVAASDTNSYAIRSDGGLFAWGYNNQGQIGNNTVTTTTNYSWTQVNANTSALFRRSDNKIFTLAGGATGDPILQNKGTFFQDTTRYTGTSLNTIVPYGNDSYAYVYAGSSATGDINLNKDTGNRFTGIDLNGKLKVRGTNYFGELGNNSRDNSFSITQIGTSSWTQVVIGTVVALGIRSDGALFTWGSNLNGYLGQGLYPGNNHKSSPVQVGTSSWTQVAIDNTDGVNNAVGAIRTDGALFMWGAQGLVSSGAYLGMLGNNNASATKNISFTIVNSGACKDSNGEWYIIRGNNGGDFVLGNATDSYSYGLLQKFAGNDWSVVTASYAIKNDGSLYNWGIKTNSITTPLAAGEPINSPVQVGTSSWSFVVSCAANFPVVAAIRSDGALFTWGTNTFGALGNGSVNSTVSPTQIGSSSWIQVDTVGKHTLAIRSDGALFAWGLNSNGQLGDGTTISKSSPVQIGTSSWSQIGCHTKGVQSGDDLGSASANSFAIRIDGALFGWGSAGAEPGGFTTVSGGIGDNTTISKSSPVQIGTSSWSFIGKTGLSRAQAAIRADGALFTWGRNTFGEVGDGTTIPRSSPVQIGTSSWIFANSNRSGNFNAMWGILTNGQLYRWGAGNAFLGAPANGFTSSPVQVGNVDPRFDSPIQIGTSSWSQLSIGKSVVAAIRADGALFGWGYGNFIGDNSVISKSSPVQIGTSSWTQVVCGMNQTVAIRSDGALFCWGALGRVGDNSFSARSSPVLIGATSSWTAVGSGSNASWAVRSDGALFGWGFGVIGNNDPFVASVLAPTQINSFPYVSSPVQIGTSSWSLVTAGKSYASAIRSDGKLFAWGVNTNYNLGDGTPINRSSPVQIGTSSWTLVNAGTDFTLGITSNSALYGWGNNNNFAVGVPDFVNPIISAGFSHGAIVSRKGKLFTWGSNNFGQLGDGTIVNRSSIAQIGTSSWSLVSGGSEHTLALNSAGQLYAWGRNDLGQLGDNTSINKSSPVQIGTSSWAQIKAGISHSMAVRIDGALFTWGSNSFGQLGRSDTLPLNSSSPVQVGTSSWTFATTNRETAYAIRSDGALFGWGLNNLGQIGNNAVNISGVMSWTQVATGRGIRSDGGLFTWGSNSLGQLGDGTTTDRISPVQIGTSSWTQVNGNFTTVALRSDGALFTWGQNTVGQLGSGTTVSRSSPVQVGTSSWTQVQAGTSSVAAIRLDGGLFTWGLNNVGQLGSVTTVNRSSPVQVGTSSWTNVAAGNLYYTAIRSDGALFAWGDNTYGQIGDGSFPFEYRSSPVQIGTSSWTQISNGANHSLAIRNGGSLFAWGRGDVGQIGNNTTLHGTERTYSWTQLSLGYYGGGGIRNDGALFTWTAGTQMPPGDGTFDSRLRLLNRIGTSSWSQLTAGFRRFYAIRADKALFAWGYNDFGILGNNSTLAVNSPVQIGSSSWNQVASGFDHAVAVRSDGALFSWGSNYLDYLLGDGTTIDRSSPVLIGGTSSWTQVGAGVNNSLAIRSDGSLFMWGRADQPGNGNGTTFGSDVYSWTQISTGASHSVALNSLGQLWAWGNNTAGQLGNSTTVTSSSPVLIGSSSWTQVFAGANSAAAIRSDGRLFTWGSNAFGQLGDGTTASKSSPVQIGTSSWTQVAIGFDAVAIRSDGSLFTWGYNFNGNLGDNTTVNKSSPVQIGTSSWSQVKAATGTHILAIRSNGSLFAWGGNYSGQLGDNTTVDKSSPVQIGTSSWSQVSTGLSNNSGAIRSDGGLFIWGGNEEGQTATNTYNYISSPVQVGTSSWTQLALGIGKFAIRSDGRLFAWGSFQTSNSPATDLLGTGISTYIDYRQSWSQLAAGAGPTFATIKNDGSLYTWGGNESNDYVSVNPNFGNLYYPTNKVGSSSWSQVAAGFGFIAAIRTDGGLFTWGLNNFGQLGDGTTVNRSSPVQVGTSSWTQISVKQEFRYGNQNTNVMAIRKDGALFAWGHNLFGQLGDNTTVNKSSPVQIGTSSWTLVKTDFTVSIGIRSDGALFTWGRNVNGALGDNTTVNKSSPVQIGTSSWIQVAPGGAAIRSDGALFVWGNNNSGQIGDNTTVNKSSPVQIGTSSWTMVTSKIPSHTAIASFPGQAVFAIRSDGSLFGWGHNEFATVGDGTFINRSSPVQIGIGSSWTYVTNNTLGGAFTSTVPPAAMLAIRSDGTVYVWGGNATGNGVDRERAAQWGKVRLVSPSGPYIINSSAYTSDGNIPLSPTPVGYYGFYNSPVQVGTDSWIQISSSSSGNRAIGIRNNNKMYAWGANTSTDPLGDGTTIPRSSPVQIGFDSVYRTPTQISTSSWTQVAVGADYTLAISSGNRLYTWGFNGYGQLGDGSTLNSLTIQERGVYSWTQIATGGRSAFSYDFAGVTFAAIRSDGGLFTWGDNTYGSLGNNTGGFGTARSSPVQVGTSSWIQVSVGPTNVLAIRYGDYAVFGWGAGGTVGDNTGINRSSPVQIGSLRAERVYCGNVAFAIEKWTNTLRAWGFNAFGQVGDGTTINRSSPVLIGTSKWSQITANYFQSIAIREDGGLFTWGSPEYGQLADNSTAYRSSPVQVGTSSWTQVKGSPWAHALAIRKDGALFTWGSYSFGQGGRNEDFFNGGAQNISKSWSVVCVNDGSISAGIQTDGSLYLWGISYSGESLNLTPSIGITIISPAQVGTSSWSQVATGNAQGVLAIRTDGALFAWGGNPTGGVGDNTTISKSSPVQIGTSSWTQVTYGYNTAYAIRSDGALFSWGSGSSGALGSNATTSRSSPVQIGTSSWSQIKASAGDFVLAIRKDGALFAWGSNYIGQVGDSTTVNRSSPVQIGNSSWSQIGVDAAASFAIRTDGSLFSWGSNGSGQLGDNTTVNKSSPVQIGTSSWIQVGPSIAIRTDGALFTWGAAVGVGLNDNINRSSPVQLGTSSWSIVPSISTASYNLRAALRSDRALFTWGGYDSKGQGTPDIVQYAYNIGLNGTSDTGSSSPVQVGLVATYNSPVQIGTSSWSQIAATAYTSSAIRADGAIFTWGRNNFGQLGDNTTVNKSSPIQIGSGSWVQIDGNQSSFYGLAKDSTLYVWGCGGNSSATGGALGDGTTTNKSSPVQLGYSGSWINVAAGIFSQSAAIRSDGALFAWGYNAKGSYGDSTTINRSSPIQIGTSSWTQVSVDGETQAAIRSDGIGYISGALLTDGAFVNRSSPVVIGPVISLSSPTQIGTSSWTQTGAEPYYESSYARRLDGGFFVWGQNNFGQLADNTTINKSSPVQVGTSSWTQVRGAAAILSNNTLYTWGSFASLGDNTAVSKSSPVQLGSYPLAKSPIQIGTSSWTTISAGGTHAVAIRSNGSLFGWGLATSGQVGDGTLVSKSSPVQIGSSSWTAITAGNLTSYGITSAKLLFAWGGGANGTFGDGTTTNKPSPVQISAAAWNDVSSDDLVVYATRNDGKLFAWGQGIWGQIGEGNTAINRSSPIQIGTTFPVPTLVDSGSWSFVSAGFDNSIGIDSNKKAYIWGNDRTNTYSWNIVGFNHAIRSDGALFMWGANGVGQLGDGTTVDKSSPVQIGTSSWSQVVSGFSNLHTLAIRADGALFAWGMNPSGQLGDNTIANKSSPVQIGTSSWSVLPTKLAEWSHAIRIDGALFGWGRNVFFGPYGGQVGDNTSINRSSPVQIGTSSWTQISHNNYTTYAIRKDGALFAWGGAGAGEVGDNTTIPRSSPVQIGTSSWSMVSGGGISTTAHAIRVDGALFGWGSSNRYPLGINDYQQPVSSPIQIGTSSWISVNSDYRSHAIRSDNTIFTWGQYNVNSANVFTYISPVQITALSGYSWVQVKTGPTGNYTSAAIFLKSTNNKFYTWIETPLQPSFDTYLNNFISDYNEYSTPVELLGIISYSSPTQIGIGGTWIKGSAGKAQNYLINNANVLYSWGTRLLSGGVINYDNSLTAVVADIDSAVADKALGSTRGYIEK